MFDVSTSKGRAPNINTMLQPLLTPVWKWEHIMDFVILFPQTKNHHDLFGLLWIDWRNYHIFLLLSLHITIATIRLPKWPLLKLYSAESIICQFVGLKWVKPSLGPELVQLTTEKVKLIRERMKIAQNCKKSYEDNHRELEFQKSWSFRRETSYLWRFLRQKALCSLEEKENEPRYIKPFEILKRVGAVAYRIALPLFILNS